jgi:hypothetical protein
MIKNHNTLVLLLFVLLFGTILLSPDALNEKNEGLDDLNSSLHLKALSIDGNAQLSAAAFAGNGTKANPYILEGYVNETITISNTNAYFILRNCTVSYQNPAPSTNFKFDNVSNGIIVNNTYSHAYSGSGYTIFQLLNSNNNTLANNTMVYNSGTADNLKGLYLSNSDGNVIINNDFSNNRQDSGGDCYIVQVISSDFNIFSQNKICNNLGLEASSHAVHMSSSNNNIITQNWICDNRNYTTEAFYNSYGIEISGTNNSVTWNIFHNNTVQAVIGGGNTVKDNDWHIFELITNGQLSPSTGDTKTTYTYSISYTDIDNTAPSLIRVIIDGTPFNMSKQDTGDNDYTDGCIYQYKTKMEMGNHAYRFEASNGTDSERLVFIGAYSGPEVSQHQGIPGFIFLYGTISIFALMLIYLRKRKSYKIF